MPNIDFPTNPTVGLRYTFAGVTYTYTAQGVWSPGMTIVTTNTPQGRLTLQSGVPVMTTTSSGHTSMFYSPYVGNKVPVWTGANYAMRMCAEIMTTTIDTVKNPAPLAANKVNDWFVWVDPADGTVRLCHGIDWASDTARASPLVRVEGLLLNAADIANGPLAQRGTYVGTTLSNANAQLDWIYGTISTPPVAGWFSTWNMYNRVQVSAQVSDLTASWTYASNARRQINGNTAAKVTYVNGQAEDSIMATAVGIASSAQGVYLTGVGFDTDTIFSGIIGATPYTGVSSFGTAVGRHSTAALGKHVFSHLEAIHAPGYTTTVYGAALYPTYWPAPAGQSGGTSTALLFDGRF